MSWTPLTLSWLLAAGGRRTDRIGRTFQPEEDFISSEPFLILIALLLLIAIVAGYTINWLQQRSELPFNNPRKLFRELCRAHRLNNSQRRLLQDIAAWHQLPNPSTLFLQRELFESPALASALGNSAGIEALRDVLFDDRPETDSASDVATNTTLTARFYQFIADLKPVD